MTPILASLFASGLGTIATEIFNTSLEKGEDFVQDFFKDKLGMDLDFNKELTEKDIVAFKHKESLIMSELASTKEKNRHEEFESRQNLEYAKLDVEDVSSARDANVVYSNSTSWLVRNFLQLFSFAILVAMGLSIHHIFNMELDSQNQVVINSILEFEKAVVLMIIGFWFGSSHGSKSKDNSLDRALKGYRGIEDSKEQYGPFRPNDH